MPSKITPAIIAATGCFAAVGVAAATSIMPHGQTSPTFEGPGVSIAVVDPREPDIKPGSVMDVGELTDGYKHRPYVRQADYVPIAYEDTEAWLPEEPRRVDNYRTASYEPAPPPVIIERRERPRILSFGFDDPRPDYAAERRERMARMEEQRRMDDERMRYRQDYDRSRQDRRSDDRYEPRREVERRVYRSSNDLPAAETFY
jgi:hypothetical protein